MSLESAIADLVSASTQLTQSVNVTRATVEATRDTVIAQEAPVTVAKDAVLASTTAATTDAATTASKLTAAAADYAAQKTTKGLAAVQTSADTELKDRLHRRDPARYPFRGAVPSLVMDFVRRECHRANSAGNLEPVDLSTFMTFTRGSTATYVGPDGLIKEAASNVPRYGYDPVTGEALGLLIEEQRTNLFQYSSAFNESYWTKSNVVVQPYNAIAPDGSLTAQLVKNTPGVGSCFNKGYTFSNGVYTRSIFVKPDGSGYSTIAFEAIGGVSGSGYSITFNSVTKTFSGDTATPVSNGYRDVGAGWLFVWVTVEKSDTKIVGTNIYIGAYGATAQQHGVYLWGAQLEAGAFPTSYIPTPATFTGRASTKTYFDSNGVLQTAASGVAVTDYGYVDGRWVSKGLSLEPQATNLLTKSEQVLWTNGQTGNTVGLSLVTNTDPCTNAAIPQMVNALVTGTPYHPYISSWGAVVTAGGVYTLTMRLRLTTGESDLTSISMYNGTSISSTGFPVKAADGFKTVTLTFSSVATGSTYPMVNCSKYDLVYMQLETGPVATSYIPTTTAQVTRAADTSTSAQVTRAADSAVSTQAGALYNLEGGTTCVTTQQYIRRSWPGLYLWDGDYSIFATQGMNYLGGRGSAGAVGIGNAAPGASLRHALRQNRTAVAASQNASSPVSATLPRDTTATVSRLVIGKGAPDYYNAHIKQLTYFPRQLSDADLQALTILED